MSPSDIHNILKTVSISDTPTLKTSADTYVSADATLLHPFTNGFYREYNKRRFYEAAGDSMITPYDAGFRPIGYSPSVSSSFLLLEDGVSDVLLESGDKVILE